jgi:hypothetical protein
MLTGLSKGRIQQCAVDRFFMRAGRLAQADSLTLVKVGRKLVSDVLLEAA